MSGKSIGLNCFTCQSRERTEWCSLTEDELTLLDKAKGAKEYDAGELVFNQGDDCLGVHCIESGLIGLRSYDAEGHSVLVRLKGPGETMGYQFFLTGSEYSLNAEVILPSRICFIDRGLVRQFLTLNPLLGLRFLETEARELTTADDKFVRTVTQTAKIRVLHILMVLYERFGRTTDDGHPILELPLSRQDLAALIGVTPESISRAIQKIENERIVRFDGRTVVFNDMEMLFSEIGLSG